MKTMTDKPTSEQVAQVLISKFSRGAKVVNDARTVRDSRELKKLSDRLNQVKHILKGV